MVCRAVYKVHNQMQIVLAMPSLPLDLERIQRQLRRTSPSPPMRLIWALLDGGYNPPQCDGFAFDIMSYWTFSDCLRRKQGVVKNPVLWRLRSHGRGWHSQARFQRLRTTSRIERTHPTRFPSPLCLLVERMERWCSRCGTMRRPEQSGSLREKLPCALRIPTKSMPRFRGWTASTGTSPGLREDGSSALPTQETDSGNFAVRRISPRPKPSISSTAS